MKTNSRMPVLFAGHGSPMNAVEKTEFGDGLHLLGSMLPRPKSILIISAHWQTSGTQVVGSERPQIIHDFYGFPEKLFKFNYPALGSPALASRVQELLPRAEVTEKWGLDHGSWSVLTHLFTKGDIPVVQMSLDENLSLAEHYALAQKLKPLRDEGVLIIGSGNIIHNLRQMRMTDSTSMALPWAVKFDGEIARALEERRHEDLVNFETLWPEEGRLSVPTLEHYIPLLYTAAVTDSEDTLTFPITGYQMAAISMRTALWA